MTRRGAYGDGSCGMSDVLSDEDGYQVSPIVVGFEAEVTPCDGRVMG